MTKTQKNNVKKEPTQQNNSKASNSTKKVSEQLSNEAINAFSKYLRNTKHETNELESDTQSREQDFLSLVELQIKSEHNKTINAVLSKYLAPQLKENEVQKRKFKERLMKYIIRILTVQLVIFLLVVLIFAFSFCFKTSFTKDISIEQLKHIVEFLKYYISAVIVAFIAMLFFIVKFVFDRSIVGLIKQLFKKDN